MLLTHSSETPLAHRFERSAVDCHPGDRDIILGARVTPCLGF